MLFVILDSVRPSTPAGHLPLFMSLMIDGTSKVQGERNRMYSNCRAAALTRRAFLLKCSAKVQKKIIQTKFFANYFSIILGYKHPQKEVILPGWLRSSIRSATTARLVGYGHQSASQCLFLNTCLNRRDTWCICYTLEGLYSKTAILLAKSKNRVC